MSAPLWRYWLLGLAACLPETASPDRPPRERDVLIDAFPGGTLVYQDGAQPWQLVPPVGDRFGFDPASNHFGVALIDVARRHVDVVYGTVAERPDLVFPPRAELVPAADHVATGTVAGFGAIGGVVAGRARSRLFAGQESSQTYELPVADGLQTIVFGREGVVDSFGAIDAVIVRRDVVVAGDIVVDGDFATEGIATVGLPFAIDTHGVLGSCGVGETFYSFGGTAVELARGVKRIIVPGESIWRAGDHLDLQLLCSSGHEFRQIFRTESAFETIPTTYDAPTQLPIAGATAIDGHYRIAWDTYPSAATFYRAVLGNPFLEVVWNFEITQGYVDANPSSSNIAAISPPDLEALGAWDPALALPEQLEWSIAAVSVKENERLEAGRNGVFTP